MGKFLALTHRGQALLASAVRHMGVRAYLVFALIFSVVIVADWGIQSFVSGAEIRLFDTLISKRIFSPKPDPDIVILDIDEASLAGMAAKHGRWPWANEVFGELVRGIEAQQPRAIVSSPTATACALRVTRRSTPRLPNQKPLFSRCCG
jgi:CHASE2 domain-containing sensor protein